MRKDPTEFRKRFAAWKNGKLPYKDGIPYDDDNHNLEYDHARAALLGYQPDQAGHYDTRDYETGRYLKSPIHPTVMKGIVSDLGVGYIPYYNQNDGLLYSHTWMKPYKKDEVPTPYKYKDGKLPGYYTGLIPWGDTKEQKAVREWGEDWENRAIAGRSKVLLKWSARGKKPQPESSEEYTKRRVAEETKMTPVTRAIGKVMDLPANIQATPGAATSYPAFGQYMPRVQSTIGTEIGNLLDVAFAPQMPGDIVKVLNFVRNIPKRYVAPLMIAREMKKGLGEVPSLYSDDRLFGTWNRVKYVNPRIQSQKSSSNISWADAQKPLSATEIFPNEVGEGWLKHTADRLGININHYYNNLITPEELAQSAKNYGFEHLVPKNAYTEPAYIPSGFPYGLDKSKILMPYDAIRKMPAMAKYANLPDAEFRKIADNLIGSHEFIHWWNQQLRKNINAGKMKAPVGFLDYELTWVGPNTPSGIDEDLLGNILGYITEANGTESNARTGLLFNAFGLKKGQLRSLHINLAKKFYRKVFPDNLMLRFLDAIKDKDRFIEWANRNAGTLFGLTAPALTIPNITNTQNELRNK